MTSTILILGGTGIVGRGVAKQLLADGYTVRILTRDGAGAKKVLGGDYEVIEGDMTDPACLEFALVGCDGVHISLPSGHNEATLQKIQVGVTASVAKLAVALGIKHITYVSGYLVSAPFAHIPAEKAKLDAERAIIQSGAGYTIFRPTYFADLLPNFIQGARASIFGKQPHPIRFLTIADFAKIVSVAHQIGATNKAYFVCGKEALTFEQALSLVTQKIAPSAKVTHAPFWMMGMMNRLFLKGELTEILALMRATEQVGEMGYSPDEAYRVFGEPTSTIAGWANLAL